jgi:hypothetical protein
MNTIIPSKEENPNGLHHKYIILKENGEPVDKDAIYLVLRLDNKCNDSHHLNACRDAAIQYCNSISDDLQATHLHQTALELYQLVIKLQEEQNDT